MFQMIQSKPHSYNVNFYGHTKEILMEADKEGLHKRILGKIKKITECSSHE